MSRYDAIFSFLVIWWRHTWIKLHLTSYLLTCSLNQKMSRFKVFQYEIYDRMSCLGTLYINFDIFRKKIPMGKNFRKSRASSWNFNRFSIWRRFWTDKQFFKIIGGSCKNVTTPPLTLMFWFLNLKMKFMNQTFFSNCWWYLQMLNWKINFGVQKGTTYVVFP